MRGGGNGIFVKRVIIVLASLTSYVYWFDGFVLFDCSVRRIKRVTRQSHTNHLVWRVDASVDWRVNL